MRHASRGVFGGTFEGSHGQDPNADDLVFYTTAPSPLHPDGANGEIKQVELTMYQPDNSTDHILVRRSINSLSHPLVQPTAHDEILCRHVQSFNLFYFDGSTWQDTWDSTSSQPANSLPLAVQVVFVRSNRGDESRRNAGDRDLHVRIRLSLHGRAGSRGAGEGGLP